MSVEAYATVMAAVADGHRGAPDGLSLEIGTSRGGTALGALQQLRRIYGPEPPPFITVDPYGGKAHYRTDTTACLDGATGRGIYSESFYQHMKRVLAEFGNHHHFSLTSTDFISALLARANLWQYGKPRLLSGFAYILLDGDHNATTIDLEVVHLYPHLCSGGVMLADDVNHDPKTVPTLRARGLPFELLLDGRMAIWRKR
ncbi:MAG TPA: class I SAM-dependent methyltransferase [Reyranellaceae bacterium]|nr:class I SAM-dependent methyltransferase [Reyranellaceae bacterium]